MILFLLIILIFTFIYLILKKKKKEFFNEITKKDLDDLDLEINSKYKNILSEIYKINDFLGIKDQKETTTIVKPKTTTFVPNTTTQLSQKTKESIKKSKTCNGKLDHEECKEYPVSFCNNLITKDKVQTNCPVLCDTCPTKTTKPSIVTTKVSKKCKGKSDHEECKTYDKQLCNHPIVGKQVSLACPILCDTC